MRCQDNTLGGNSRSSGFKLCLTIIVHNYSALSNGDVHSVTIKNIIFYGIVDAC